VTRIEEVNRKGSADLGERSLKEEPRPGGAGRPASRSAGLGAGLWSLERRAAVAAHLPGVMFSITLGMAATFVSTVYGGPTILFALLLGMAFNFLAAEPRFTPGLAFSSRSVLRLGVALLGARITLEQIVGLGWSTLAGVAAAVALTILFGLAAASAAGLKRRFGVLTAGAVAICGASAAAAIAAVLPRHATQERDTAFTIIGVTTLSTVAMVLYPLVAALFGFTDAQTGVFLGGTIHDVAQVVGAGFSVSAETGEVATIIKLLRVALLVPTVLAISLLFRRAEAPRPRGGRPSSRASSWRSWRSWHLTACASCRPRCSRRSATRRTGAS
jgi:uncharacterized integral membrane protein (TIGR00698 family)